MAGMNSGSDGVGAFGRPRYKNVLLCGEYIMCPCISILDSQVEIVSQRWSLSNVAACVLCDSGPGSIRVRWGSEAGLCLDL